MLSVKMAVWVRLSGCSAQILGQLEIDEAGFAVTHTDDNGKGAVKDDGGGMRVTEDVACDKSSAELVDDVTEGHRDGERANQQLTLCDWAFVPSPFGSTHEDDLRHLWGRRQESREGKGQEV